MAEKPEKIYLEVVTPRAAVIAESVDDVVLPAHTGEAEVLPGHRPFLTFMRPGRLVVKRGQTEDTYFIAGGFAEVLSNRINILADECELASEIVIVDAKEGLDKAKASLDEHKNSPEDERAPFQLAAFQAEIRLKLAQNAKR